MNHGPMPPSAGALTSYGEIERYIARARELRAEATAAMLWENTAVPRTRMGGWRLRLARNDGSEGAPRYSRWNKASRPLRQVDMRAKTPVTSCPRVS